METCLKLRHPAQFGGRIALLCVAQLCAVPYGL